MSKRQKIRIAYTEVLEELKKKLEQEEAKETNFKRTPELILTNNLTPDKDGTK